MMTQLYRYTRQRLSPGVILPVLCFTVLASMTAVSEPVAERLALRVGLALVLIVGWRLRDDLYSVPEDRLSNPARVLTRVTSLTPFYAVVGVLWLSGMAMAFALHSIWGALTLWVLSLMLEGIYGWRGWSRQARGLALVTPTLKYGGLVCVLAGSAQSLQWPELWSAVAICAATFAAYDVLEDAHFDAWRHRSLGLTLALLVPGVSYVGWAMQREAWWVAAPLALWMTWVCSVCSRPEHWMQRRLAWLVFVVNALILSGIWWFRLFV